MDDGDHEEAKPRRGSAGGPTTRPADEKNASDAAASQPKATASDAAADEGTEETAQSKPRRLFRWPGFLKPTDPSQALALVVIGATLGAGATQLFEVITKDEPWTERADRVCLDRGDEYLSVAGERLQRLRGRIKVTQAALSDLREIRSAVPTESVLDYNTLLGYKEDWVGLLKRKLALIRAGRPVGPVNGRLRGVDAVYEQQALGLGLAVCGQGTGKQ